MLCKRCAAPIDDGEKICIHCGADQEDIHNSDEAPFEDLRNLTFFDCLITFFVGSIPIIGTIMLLIWSFGTEKIKGRSTVARAFLLWSVFVLLLVTIAVIYLSYVAVINSDLM